MPISEMFDRFRIMPVEEIAAVLLEVAKYEHGKPFVSAILGTMDDKPEFDALFENDALMEYY
jgi:hypothetical protein